MTQTDTFQPVVLVRWDGGAAVGGHAEVFRLSVVGDQLFATNVDDEWWVEQGSNFWSLLAALAGLNDVECTGFECSEMLVTSDLTLA